MRRIAAIVVVILLAGCSSSTKHTTAPTPSTVPPTARATTTTTPRVAPTHRSIDIYAADRPNNLSPVARRAKPLVYVPNSKSNTVDVIDPSTARIVEHFAVGRLPQHIVPAWDM